MGRHLCLFLLFSCATSLSRLTVRATRWPTVTTTPFSKCAPRPALTPRLPSLLLLPLCLVTLWAIQVRTRTITYVCLLTPSITLLSTLPMRTLGLSPLRLATIWSVSIEFLWMHEDPPCPVARDRCLLSLGKRTGNFKLLPYVTWSSKGSEVAALQIIFSWLWNFQPRRINWVVVFLIVHKLVSDCRCI